MGMRIEVAVVEDSRETSRCCGLRRLSASEPRTRQRVRINSNLGFGLLPGRSDGSTASEAMDVLLLLLSGLENLKVSS